MFERRALKKLLRETVEASVIVASRPLMSIDTQVLQLFPAEVWNSLCAKYYSDTASDPIIIKAVKDLMAKRLVGFESDLLDLLEEKVQYTKIKCPICGDRLYMFPENETICLKCYQIIPKEVDNGPGETQPETVPDVQETPV